MAVMKLRSVWTSNSSLIPQRRPLLLKFSILVNQIIPPWPSCHLGLNSTFHRNGRINHVGVFFLGITVWETDARAGGRTPDRRQPAGAMQAGVRDRQHEQHQVLGAPPLPLPRSALPWQQIVLCLFSLRSLAVGLERPFRCGEGIVPDLTWDVQTVFRMAWLVGTWNSFNKINTSPKANDA